MSNNPMQVPSDPNAIGKIGEGVSSAIGKVADFFNKNKEASSRVDHFAAGHEGARTGGLTVEHIAAIGNVMKDHQESQLKSQEMAQGHSMASQTSSQEHEIRKMRVGGQVTRANTRQAYKSHSEVNAAPGSKVTSQVGEVRIANTAPKAPAKKPAAKTNMANTKATTTMVNPAAKPAAKPATKAAAAKPSASQAAKRPRGGK